MRLYETACIECGNFNPAGVGKSEMQEDKTGEINKKWD